MHTFDGRKKLSKERLSKEDIINHFCKINNCSKEDFQKHEKLAFDVWKKRSKYNWEQNLEEFKAKKP